MKSTSSGFYPVIIVLIVFLLMPRLSLAQHHSWDYDENPEMKLDTGNAFCKKLSRIMLQTDIDFADAKDSLMDSTGQHAWTCRENFMMPGSRNCTIFRNGGKTTYVAFYLKRGSKEALAPSYNNLYHQLKDCLGYQYVYTDKKTTAAEKLMGEKRYECEMEPFGDGIKEQADMLISIEKMPDGNYELIMQIMKYTGKYSNRNSEYNDGK